MRTLGWGIIGCSEIAAKRFVPAVNQIREARLVAVLSRDLARAQQFADRHGIERAYADRAAFLRDPEVEAVYVASPPYRHCAEVLAAAEAGKHVLCEKPLALTGEECRRMVDACRRNGVRLAVAYPRRYYPKVQKARALLEAGAIGQLVAARVFLAGWDNPDPSEIRAWRLVKALAGGGPLMDVGSHRLDLLAYLLGEPVDVLALADRLVHRYEVEDSAALLLRFRSNNHLVQVSAAFHWNLGVRRDEFELLGTQGSISLTPLDGPDLVLRVGRDEERASFPPAANVQLPLVEDFTRRVLAGQDARFPGEEGMKASLMIDAAYESARTGRRIEVPPAPPVPE